MNGSWLLGQVQILTASVAVCPWIKVTNMAAQLPPTVLEPVKNISLSDENQIVSEQSPNKDPFLAHQGTKYFYHYHLVLSHREDLDMNGLILRSILYLNYFAVQT